MNERARQQDHPRESRSEEPMSSQRLAAPEMKTKIAEAKERARRSKGGSGKTADDLMRLARDQRGVDTRT
jgi:hypothetical protein